MARIGKLRRLCIPLAAALLLVGGYLIARDRYVPRLAVPDGVELTNQQREAILSMAQGRYNDHLPLFARRVEILEATENRILYRILYFPLGNIECSYAREPDGVWLFNMEKPLSGLS